MMGLVFGVEILLHFKLRSAFSHVAHRTHCETRRGFVWLHVGTLRYILLQVAKKERHKSALWSYVHLLVIRQLERCKGGRE